MKIYFKKALPDFLFVLGFAVVTLVYCSPVLKNKMLIPNDPVQSLGLAKESMDYKDKFGELPWWTNSAFGGMPTYLISSDFPNGVFSYVRPFTRPFPGSFAANDIFLALIGAYILLMALQKNRWIAAMGAIGYTFCTLTILYLEAGHSSKIQALAFSPMVLAGIIYAYKNQKLWAVLAFSIGLGFEVNSNHLQITYYLLLACVVFTGFLLYYAYKEGVLRTFFINLILIGIGGLLASTTQAGRLMSTLEFGKETIRGTSELTLETPNANSTAAGLSKDYAFSWSYGKVESFTFLIPEFSGGSSSGTLPKNSASASYLAGLGMASGNINQFLPSLPSYWGDQIFVSGPAYLGAILCFLFLLALLISKSRFKYPLLACTILLLFISWGDNFKIFGYFMFDHMPFYNKFRSVNMGVSLMQLFVVAIAGLGIAELLKTQKTFDELKKPLLISFGITGGICLLIAILPGVFFDFTSLKDAAFVENMKRSFGDNTQAANGLYSALLEDRETLAKQDALRSLIFILLSAGLVFVFIKKKVNATVFAIVMLLLVTVDIWQVDKRYFNDEDFKFNRNNNAATQFPQSAADAQILADTDPNFRVLNTTIGFWSSAKESYYHKSIGGYHGAKLKSAQELYEHALIKEGRLNMPILNMMNTKYFIVNGENGLQAQLNPGALGNAWFVDSLTYANSANEEMTILADLNVSKKAVVDSRFKDQLGEKTNFNSDSSSIKLTSYLPNDLKYTSSSSEEGLAVFSEMYYRGNKDWKSYIDGIETPHVRINYVLRGLKIPAGNHEIVFHFEPDVVKKGNTVDLISSVLLVVFLSGMIFYSVKKKP
ncbi:MAG: hypothetical protein ACI9IP_000955 [Arcticibacterium sp.]|jgi:hypothetical protein